MKTLDDLLTLVRENPLSNDEKELAAILHGYLCPTHHDMVLCHFFLSDWDDPDFFRCYFLLKARSLLKLTKGDLDLALSIVKVLLKE